MEIDGYTIYVYTPEMIVYEKIRAICQQFPEYYANEGKFKKARPRDFYDIYSIMTFEGSNISFTTLSYDLLKTIFDKKHVPLELINLIPKYYDKFESSVSSLTETLNESSRRNFNFRECFDFVVDGIKKIPRR